MRSLGLAVLCASAISIAQTSVRGTATVGVNTTAPLGIDGASGTTSALTAFDVLLERSFASTFSVGAHLAAQISASPTAALSLQDLGSSVRIQFRGTDWDTEAIFLELFPFDGQRVRATFDQANVWGRPTRPLSVAPLIRIGLERRSMSLWASARAYQQLDNRTLETRLRWTAMLGGGAALPGGFRSDLILSASDRGDVPGLANQGVATSIIAVGTSVRVAHLTGGGVQPALDPASYRSDPDRFNRLFADESYLVSRASYVGLEGGVASQNLEDPDVFGKLRREFTGHADLQGRLRLQQSRFFATLRYRHSRLVNFDGPGVPPFRTLPQGTVLQDEYTALVGVDHRFVPAGVTLGLTGRLLRPAAFKAPSGFLGGNNPPGLFNSSRVVVLSDNGIFQILPVGHQALPAIAVTASILFSRFQILSALLLLDYAYDPNRSVFVDGGIGEPVRTGSHGVRAELLLQLRL